MGLLARHALALLVLAASSGSAGCGSTPPDRAEILLTLDTGELGTCAESSCEAYFMTCGARLSIRVTDIDTHEVLLNPNGRRLELCLDAAVSENICSLKDLAPLMELDGMPASDVRVEVAVWNADDVGPEGGCPITEFDLYGRPSVDSVLQPAFGGATFFRAGVDSEISVPLSCTAPSRLNSPSCAANIPTQTRARVRDIDALQNIQDESLATALTVRVGTASLRFDNEGNEFYELGLSNLSELDVDLDGSVEWNNAIPLPNILDGDLVCSATLEFGPQTTPTVTCENATVDIGESGEEDVLEVSPLYLSVDVLSKILDALGIESFPEDGLVVGRVVTEAYFPLSGVEVIPSDGSTVLYLNEDLSLAGPGQTSDSAFFVSTSTVYGARWTARSSSGTTQTGQPRGGQIRGTVSAVLIRMISEANE